MSGLCGIVHFDGTPVEPDQVRPMADEVAHRGPDGIHAYSDDSASLCHLKLNVYRRDLLDTQPLVGNDGVVVLCDSRLDNRSELCAELGVEMDDADDSPADSTLILAAYQKWGTESAEHLLGDFAFAIWDPTQKHVYAARDAMGMRAFYYRSEPGRFLFGTEVKQILEAPGVPCEINEQAVASHLRASFGNLGDSFYDGISQLEPAHALVAASGEVKSWRYWDVRADDRIDFENPVEYEVRFRELFLESVSCRTRNALSAGIMLSGGLDSGSIASAAAFLKEKNNQSHVPGLRAYCWAFDSVPECDERHLSRLVTGHYSIPTTEIVADEAWPLHHYPDLLPDRDEPSIGAYEDLEYDSLSAARTDGIKMMMWGFRGDLMVGGWVFDYFYLIRRRLWKVVLDELREHAKFQSRSQVGLAFKYLFVPIVGKVFRRLRQRKGTRREEKSAAAGDAEWVDAELRQIPLADNYPPIPSHIQLFSDRQRYSMIFTPMHMRVATWSERSCATHGMSFCDPWSDRRLAVFCISVPQQLLDAPGEVKKDFVRRSLKDLLPPDFRFRAKKIVPTPFFSKALREWSRPVIEELLVDMASSEKQYVLANRLSDYYKSIKAGMPEKGEFWWTLTLEMWLRTHWKGK